MKEEKKKIITAALPYVNNRLHLGHIYSTFLPADIHKRTLKMFSEKVILVSGNDVFGYKIYLDSLFKKISVNKIKNEFKKEHIDSLKYFNISFDNFSSTEIEEHRTVVNNTTISLQKKEFCIYR